jgi:alpha-ketoglutarate-dependent 2,4-dichlorophenoxyacetate dioxygenase
VSFSVAPIDPRRPDFAGEVAGVDIAEGVAPAVAAKIEHGMDQFAVLVFRDQRIDDDQQYAFSTHFGPMETAVSDLQRPEERRIGMNLSDISNLDKHGRVLARNDRHRLMGLGNRLWHSDSSFKPTPAKFSLLSARAVPSEGGNTEFADMRAAWDELDPATQAECRDLVCEHSQMYSRSLLGFVDFTDEERRTLTPVPQRLVRRHPRTGRLSLFLAAHAGTIRGWPMPEARAFLFDLVEHATQRRFVYAHRWRAHDLVMWDNRVVMHRARRYPHEAVRDMRRTTVADSAPTLDQPI